MHPDLLNQLLNRRELLGGAGVLAAMGMSQALAGGHTGGECVVLTPEQQLELEAANETLVNNFIRDYATRDIKVWRDFGYPGAQQLVEPAPRG